MKGELRINFFGLVDGAGVELVRRVSYMSGEDRGGTVDRFLEGCGAKGMYSYISTAGDPEGVHTIPVGLWELRVDAMEMGREMYTRVLQHNRRE